MENHNKIRAQFPLLSLQESRGRYVYLDNSATTQKPEYVIKSLTDFYTETNSNVHRGIHKLSNYASILYEKSHDIVADFIGAAKEEVFFVKNCTDGLNYLASSFADSEKMQLRKGDVIVLNELEHHSNILPWMRLAKRKEMHIEWVSITANFTVDLDHLADLADKYQDRLKIVALGHVSNVLGIRNDISKAAQITHKYGGIIVVDAAQSIAHLSIDVKHFDIDFLVFSGHKIYSPLGVGVVYGKLELLEILEPAIVGGGMIADVAKDGADWIEIPWRFEAGTPSIADVI
jgi:cysteine desulfurase/selenocysteine lyase